MASLCSVSIPSTSQLVEMDRARMAAAMTRIYRLAGFQACVTAQQGVLAALAEQVRAEGGSLGGWVA